MIKEKIKKIFQFFANLRLLLCLGLAWLITNGWSNILLGIGTFLKIEWMAAVASGYLAFLWLPVSPEKIVTLALAMLLLRFLFPKDTKTLGILKNLHEKLKKKKKGESDSPAIG